ncbi:hypothetical protein DPMN_121701 [Dreissena polymorpha]|uniref:Uncharacterized protein n=1 Tax=Dreissena polymorpha TaxID=45954 RepID=A0A9D4GNA4_DREPO|nr:hypothetical protein DPMN_121701 [Dreissena polymorpha]
MSVDTFSLIVIVLWFLLVFFAKASHKQDTIKYILSKDLMNAFPFLNEELWIVPISNVPPLYSNFNDLRYERNRFTTFQNFPGFVGISFIRLAESGFYYIGSGTNIQCIFCGATHENLDAYSLHTDPSRLHNHRCSLESRTRQGNTPMHPDSPYGNNDDRTQRLPTPDLLQYNHLNAVHANQQETEALSRFGIQTRMPKHPNFAIPDSRRLTFGNSPEQLNDRAEEFARAGFFYTGKDRENTAEIHALLLLT